MIMEEALSHRQQVRLVIRLSIPAILAEISSIVMQYIDAAMVGSLGKRGLALNQVIKELYDIEAQAGEIMENVNLSRQRIQEQKKAQMEEISIGMEAVRNDSASKRCWIRK